MLKGPYFVNIMGRPYRVQYTPEVGKKTFGDCDSDKAVIRINSRLTPRVAQETLIHEVIHAILAESGYNQILANVEGLEEGLVRALERGFIGANILPNVDPIDAMD